VITTAALPWLTGTSINPLLRSAYLANERSPGKVTLMVPWLSTRDQDMAFPAGIRFNRPEEQETYIRQWLFDANLQFASKHLVRFYSGR
jgi:digalactosyldiacylglycerol synthase